MAPERVFLHIGAPKTGTTYLQGLLALNQRALQRNGILYPATRSGAHHTAVWDLRDTPHQRRDAKGIAGAWARLVDTANSWDGAAVLLSSELFVYANATQVRRALSAFSAPVHVIYTARDLARQVPAVWQERVKNQQTMTYPDFVNAVVERAEEAGGRAFWRAQDAAGVVARWSRSLAADHVHVVTVPPAGWSPTVLWDRFLSVMDSGGDGYQTQGGEPANRSLNRLQIELLRRYNERHGAALPWPAYRRTVWRELDSSFAAVGSDGPKLALSTAHYDFFAAAARDITARLRSGGYDVVGDLQDLIPVRVEPERSAGCGPAEGAAAPDGEVLGAALDVLHAVLSRGRKRR